jgi:hypothetical protein
VLFLMLFALAAAVVSALPKTQPAARGG